MQYLQGKVLKMTVVKKITDGLDQCRLQIDFDDLCIFYDSNELVSFIEQEVRYTVRPDMVDGKPESVICEIAKLSTIQTVETVENIKLVPAELKRTVCNFDSTEVRFGEYYPGRVALLSSYQLGSSTKSRWFDCKLIDINSRQFDLRIFANGEYETAEAIIQECIGRYVRFDLESTKYGYQTKEIMKLPNDVEWSPEVLVAQRVIQSELEKDEALKQYCAHTKLLEVLKSQIDGEPGYMLVRVASEIYMINAIDSISSFLDVRAMKRAAVCSRGYCIATQAAWSRPTLNMNKALIVPGLKSDMELMCILDVLTAKPASPTKLTYIKIKNLVNDIIDIRRGVINETDKISANLNDVIRSLGGLL